MPDQHQTPGVFIIEHLKDRLLSNLSIELGETQLALDLVTQFLGTNLSQERVDEVHQSLTTEL